MFTIQQVNQVQYPNLVYLNATFSFEDKAMQEAVIIRVSNFENYKIQIN